MITAEEAEYGTEEPHSSGSDVGLHPWEEQQLYSYHREQMLLGNTEQLQRRRIEAFGLEASAPPGPPRPTETAAAFSSTPPTVSQDIREEDVQKCNLCYIWCNGDRQLKMHYMSAEHKTRVAIAKRFFGLWKIMTEQSEAYLPSVRATAQPKLAQIPPSHFQGKGGRKGSGIISALNITAESIASTRPLRGGLR